MGASVVGHASFQPLKVLEPVDDTVERVSDAVFLVAAGAALAAVGLAPVVSIGLVFLGVSLLGKLCIQCFPSFSKTVEPLCEKGINFGIIVGLAIPLLFALGVWVGERATAAQMNAAVAELDAVAQQARILIGGEDDATVNPKPEDEDAGILDWLGAQMAGARDSVDGIIEGITSYRGAAQVLIEEANTILEASLTIIGVFTLRVFVLPVFLLFGAMSLLRVIPRHPSKKYHSS